MTPNTRSMQASVPSLIDVASLSAWLKSNMPKAFCEQVDENERELLASALITFEWQEGFSTLESSKKAYCLCLNDDRADLRVLQRYKSYEIRDYRTFVSTGTLTVLGLEAYLRLIILTFSESQETLQKAPFGEKMHQGLLEELHQAYPELDKKPLERLLQQISLPFIRLLSEPMLALVLHLLAKPLCDDFTQVQALEEPQGPKGKKAPLQLAISAPPVRLNPYLFQLAKLFKKRKLFLKDINATHLAPYEPDSKLLIIVSVGELDETTAKGSINLDELIHELSMLYLSPCNDPIEQLLIDQGHIDSYQGHVVRSAALFCHQLLASFDPDIYTPSQCLDAFCAHPELTQRLVELFESRFHPKNHSSERYRELHSDLKGMIEHLDSGQPLLDERRKHLLTLAMHWVDSTLKTNFWEINKLAISYRIDPKILEKLPYNYSSKFPQLPFGIFFYHGLNALGFHIRFRDLARGGLRSVLPKTHENYLSEQNGLFSEAYQLAYTQQKKNKDIPEGGAKAVILCYPYTICEAEKWALKTKWQAQGKSPESIQQQLRELETSRKLAHLYFSQKAFIESLLTLVNSEQTGALRAQAIVDYYKTPEYLFLGPDENMHNSMLIWIEQFSRRQRYQAGGAFISSHPIYGINHKQYGVTSVGLHTYLKEGLSYLGINPTKESFSVKISGGPDGDVAGNQILNLAREFPTTAKIVALTDISGTIFDPEGLDFSALKLLFETEKPISCYPAEILHEGGFLLDRTKTQEEGGLRQKTLFWKKEHGQAKAHWIASSEANLIFRENVHHTPADVFIPAGGRPRALHGSNWQELLLAGKPNCRLIVEGANLYLTQEAREALEKLGVIIFRDSSANKGGVMSSSLEVLMRLIFEPEEMVRLKPQILAAILKAIEEKARLEARLLLQEHKALGKSLSLLSQDISERINLFTDQLQAELSTRAISEKLDDPLNRILLHYAPAFLRKEYAERLLARLPLNYKRAIIASHLASQLVYTRGLNWQPSLASLFPLLVQDDLLTDLGE